MEPALVGLDVPIELETAEPENRTSCLQTPREIAITVSRMATTELDLRELRALLARRGMTQWRLAAALDVSPSALSAYLHGRVPAPPDLRRRIATVLGVDEALLGAQYAAG